ncbi:RNA polymerase sigma factor [Serratia aquatilis]|uniref:RNA polymerase sigma factor n=1 Tax=Serratia aquatilis TaxID=1737515 RepID=A0ABV6EED0_9GAMM
MLIQESQFAAAQAGDPVALEYLLVKLHPDIQRYARYQCQRSSAVDDVVQEALIILYRKVGTVRAASSLKGWLFKIITRLCMLPALKLLSGMEDLKNVENSAYLAQIPVDELRIDLVHALESLSAVHREIILLRDLQQMTISEIADHLDITQGATKSRLHRARAQVREYLLAEKSA